LKKSVELRKSSVKTEGETGTWSIILPVLLNNEHWITMEIELIEFSAMRIYIYDSLSTTTKDARFIKRSLLELLARSEHIMASADTDVVFAVTVPNRPYPRQSGTHECGFVVFLYLHQRISADAESINGSVMTGTMELKARITSLFFLLVG
jgi:Ulp1 family protease